MEKPSPILMHVDSDPEGAAHLHNTIMAMSQEVLFHHFTSGPAALGRLMRPLDNGEPYLPTLITVDLGLDQGQGLEFIVSLRKVLAFSKIPLVVLYSGTQNQDMIQTYKLGVSGCTPKPRDAMRWTALGNELLNLYLEKVNHQDDPQLAALYKARPAFAAAQKV